MTLGLEPEREAPGASRADPDAGERHVEVAIDAAGAGGARPYTYAVPPRARRPRGRRGGPRRVRATPGARRHPRRGRRRPAAGTDVKPIVDRVRADGPLLPPLTLALARWIAAHYLAPPALVIRSMLPPGLLERLELVAERTPLRRRPGGDGRRRGRRRTCSSSCDRCRGRPATWPRRTVAPGCCAGCGPRGAGADHARLDAARGVGRARATSAGSG